MDLVGAFRKPLVDAVSFDSRKFVITTFIRTFCAYLILVVGLVNNSWSGFDELAFRSLNLRYCRREKGKSTYGLHM